MYPFSFSLQSSSPIPSGDFNLLLLDQLLKQPELNMVWCCNELNAGYAADGFARKRGVGCLCVTFCVGGVSDWWGGPGAEGRGSISLSQYGEVAGLIRVADAGLTVPCHGVLCSSTRPARGCLAATAEGLADGAEGCLIFR